MKFMFSKRNGSRSLPWILPWIFLVLLAVSAHAGSSSFETSLIDPPAIRREFRAAWVATVANIDWPSKPGLPVDQQKAELISLFERAQKLNLNAILLQVRPASDALYQSKYEPWSYYLTGVEGKAPEPFYDPLTFAIQQAHLRGIEVHAWFNPFRAGHPSLKSALPSSHISKSHPSWVRNYGQLVWIDPGEKDARDYVVKVVMDVVKRYDVDGIVFDDYYYPYREKDAQGHEMDFPDSASWKKYGMRTKLSRDDWRRENVNLFVKAIYTQIKNTKPWVKFGVSPFGIWQPGFPAKIEGLNSYNVLYSDSRKWLMEGWVDYCMPQLYWSMDSTKQNFTALLSWWEAQNPQKRHIWPGLSDDRVGGAWKADEIIAQSKTVRAHMPESSGVAHWSFKSLAQDRAGLATSLKSGLYADLALVPPSPWLDPMFPAKPKISIDKGGRLSWKTGNSGSVSHWLLQTRVNGQWTTELIPATTNQQVVRDGTDLICLTAIDRCGVASPAASLQKKADVASPAQPLNAAQ